MYFRKSVASFFAVLVLLLFSHNSRGQIRYFRSAAVAGASWEVRHFLATAKDSIATDTIFQVLSKEGYPVSYYRKIRTSVCFDNKCRLLRCTLYWNVTGRYLGFELPKGEFLSKAKHKPFKKAEYERLNVLLADPELPLANMSYSELAPQPRNQGRNDDVDVVSSATAKNVLDYVVEGAAYTTYKMWHVVYGPTQDDVQGLTKKSLSADLILKILESTDPGDKIWALNHIRGYITPTPALQRKVFALIDNGQYNLAERAINSLDLMELKSDTIQILLSSRFDQNNYAIKKLIIAKFGEAPRLNAQAVQNLSQILKSSNPELISNVLDLFSSHGISDTETCRTVALLLASQNNFVAQKAYKYLSKLSVRDDEVQVKMKDFKMKE